jgi:hypothetical protein
MAVVQREHWAGHPVDLGEGFRLHKDRCGRQLEAICTLRSHPLGWELVLSVSGNLHRSEVCRSNDAVLARTDAWRQAMIDRGGWR